MTTVLVTGASGFIARHLGETLQRESMWTVGTSRSGAPLPGYDRIYKASLGDSLQPLFETERVDAVVHTALDPGPQSYSINVEGTTRWLEEASAGGVSLQILLSSLSASGDALADYGRAKYTLEQRFLAAGHVVFRMAIVVGDGGMFERLVDSARRYPVVPLLDGGQQIVYVLGIDFLCNVLADCIRSGGEGLRSRGGTSNSQPPSRWAK